MLVSYKRNSSQRIENYEENLNIYAFHTASFQALSKIELMGEYKVVWILSLVIFVTKY